ncbi:MAG TPA: pentapeptide repeat-containing protein [Nitrosopumilaceae archaeon]|nr:pentapeptide repeat-containing protein [Nitrosopumilaceae archaeon]
MKNKAVLGVVVIAFLVGTIVTSPVIQHAAAITPTLGDIFTVVTDIQTKVNSLLISAGHLQATSNAIKGKTSSLPSDPASNSHIDSAVASLATGDSIGTLQTTANAIKAKTDNLPKDPASQSATNLAITNAQSAINTHTDAAISSISSGGITESQFKILKCNATPRYFVDLSGCKLFGAVLNGVDLLGADFSSADLGSANLSGANLNDANLSSADLSSAELNNAFLIGANLSSANLNSANLSGANLRFSNINGTNFDGANLSGADFTGCTGTPVGTPASGTLPTC